MENYNHAAVAAFMFNTTSVRTVRDDGQIWFVLKDVAVALDYNESSINSLAHIAKPIPDEWRTMKPFHANGRDRELICLSEPGLYFFLGRSDKPKALPFQKWVYGEVLPQIRRTGAYAVRQKPESAFDAFRGKEFLMYIDFNGKITMMPYERRNPLDDAERLITDPSNLGLTDTKIMSIANACTKALAERAGKAMRWGEGLMRKLKELDQDKHPTAKSGQTALGLK